MHNAVAAVQWSYRGTAPVPAAEIEKKISRPDREYHLEVYADDVPGADICDLQTMGHGINSVQRQAVDRP